MRVYRPAVDCLNLSKAGWSWGCVSTVDSQGRTIWIVDAHGYGKRFIVRADEILSAFLELQKGDTQFRGEFDVVIGSVVTWPLHVTATADMRNVGRIPT